MNAAQMLRLMTKYTVCQECGSDRIGNGEGKLIVEEKSFLRSCKCGWKVEVKED